MCRWRKPDQIHISAQRFLRSRSIKRLMIITALELIMEWKQARFPAKANLREMKLCYNVYSVVQVRMFSPGYVNANFKLKLIMDTFSVRKKLILENWLRILCSIMSIGLTLAKMSCIYYKGLPLKGRECCSAKLTFSNGVSLEDLYDLASYQWLNDAKWCSSLQWTGLNMYVLWRNWGETDLLNSIS